MRERQMKSERRPKRLTRTALKSRGSTLTASSLGSVTSEPFYGIGRHTIDPYVFPEDGSVNVVHEGVLSQMITLYVTPFHEIEELTIRECFGDPQSLARRTCSAKGMLKNAQGAKVKYTAKQARAWKEAATNCEICDKEFETYREKHGDHSHITGEWRGVLCAVCNLIVGHFEKLEREKDLKLRVKKYLKV